MKMKYPNPIETYVSKIKGYKVVQLPNPPIISFVIFMVLARVLPHGSVAQHIAALLAFGSVFMWAWLEIFYGVNMFRRLLGGAVIISSLSMSIYLL